MRRVITLEAAKSQYPHRYTLEHVPAWAKVPCGGKFYAPQYRTDAEWYANTIFPGEQHIHRNEKHAESGGATWPCGQWLERPLFDTVRTDCGHGRASFRPDWDASQPWVTYRDGTAGRHFATLEAVRQYFASLGMFVSEEVPA